MVAEVKILHLWLWLWPEHRSGWGPRRGGSRGEGTTQLEVKVANDKADVISEGDVPLLGEVVVMV